MSEPIVTKRDNCPACAWPTGSKGMSMPSRIAPPPRIHPEIRAVQHVVFQPDGTPIYHTMGLEFTCARCGAKWFEEAAQ
jgi:hypothetical protein